MRGQQNKADLRIPDSADRLARLGCDHPPTTGRRVMEESAARDALRDDLIKALKGLRRVESSQDKERKTQAYREVARLAFELRRFFIVPGTGEPDWTGSSWEYRELIRGAYSAAGWSKDDTTRAQRSVRYHIARLARQELSADQVEALGLHPDDPTDRFREHRAVSAAKLATLSEPTPGAGLDVSRALAAALIIVERVAPAQVGELGDGDRAQARAVLARLRDRAEALHAAATPGE